MRVLVVDIGNTRAKGVIFEDKKISYTVDEDNLLSSHNVDYTIVVSTNSNSLIHQELSKRENIFWVDENIKVPIKIDYETPQSLGKDRLVSAVGANKIYPNTNLVVIDFGTAITMDITTDKGVFLGGNISPGATLRYQSLHKNTADLPLQELPKINENYYGKNTQQAIQLGIVEGILAEVTSFVHKTQHNFDALKVVITGGDANYFVDKLNFRTFVEENLIFIGLHRILKENL